MNEDDLYESELKKPWFWRLLTGKPVRISNLTTFDEGRLGFVETGPEAINFLVRCVREGRHVMLVGPRGTGKSYMADQAVQKVTENRKYGYVEKIEIQGDPNKPPSDYFDDSIAFRVIDKKKNPRVLPTALLAPFFRFAIPDSKGGFKTKTVDGKHYIILKNKGKKIDRLVVFWDEGNRSSPAMLNAMLSLLAEGVIRRDGRAYKFPPVSCILTRNPDGYDAQSAKLPSPLIDRFGVQLYVYCPQIFTFVEVIAPTWLRRYQAGLEREFDEAIIALPDETDFTQPASAKVELEQMKLVDRADATSVKAAIAAVHRVAKLTTIDPNAGEACEFFENVLTRLVRVPNCDGDFKQAAALLAIVVIASWGDERSPVDKPGMQYLPQPSRDFLKKLANEHPTLERDLTRLGDLTRYGTSIRAFEDLMLAVVSDAIGGDATTQSVKLQPTQVSLKLLYERLGWYLNHRCETNFNGDREPDKARRKTEALLRIATYLLDDANGSISKLASPYWTSTPKKAGSDSDGAGVGVVKPAAHQRKEEYV